MSRALVQSLLHNESKLHCFVETTSSQLKTEVKRESPLALQLFSNLFLKILRLNNSSSQIISCSAYDLFTLEHAPI